jgi:hypothetical protein
MSGSPPVARRCWLPIATDLLRKLVHPAPFGARCCRTHYWQAHSGRLDDAPDFGRARPASTQPVMTIDQLLSDLQSDRADR